MTSPLWQRGDDNALTRPTVVATIQQTMRIFGRWTVVLANQDFGRFELEMIDWRMRYTNDNTD